MTVTLSQHFGTLTLGWVVSLSDTKLIPDALSPRVYDGSMFGVRQDAEEFLPLNTQSVLYHTTYLT